MDNNLKIKGIIISQIKREIKEVLIKKFNKFKIIDNNNRNKKIVYPILMNLLENYF